MKKGSEMVHWKKCQGANFNISQNLSFQFFIRQLRERQKLYIFAHSNNVLYINQLKWTA